MLAHLLGHWSFIWEAIFGFVGFICVLLSLAFYLERLDKMRRGEF